jgi:hypothetical protein
VGFAYTVTEIASTLPGSAAMIGSASCVAGAFGQDKHGRFCPLERLFD